MATYDLAAMTRRAKPGIRRSSIVLRDIVPPAVLATDLYRSTYAPVVQAWTAASERIIAEYERSLAQITTDSAEDAESLLTTVSEAIARLVLTLTPELRSWALRVERYQRSKWIGAVLSATGVSLDTLIGPEDVRQTLETTIAWNTSLVKDVSDQARQRIGNAVFDGLRNRTPAREVAKTIRESVAMSKRRSVVIASDQLSKVTSALADERRREAGISKWKWRHSQKLHPRAEHAARDGKIYTDETAPKDLPGRLPYCGCRSQAIVEFD